PPHPETYPLSLHDALPIYPIGRAIHSAAKVESGHPGDDGLPGSLGEFDACVGKGVSALVEPTSTTTDRIRYRVLLGNIEFLRTRDRKSTRLNSSHVSISYA